MTQLTAAVGKVVTVADFQAYMRFHVRKLYRKEYTPQPMSYAVRRSGGYTPDGIVSLEASIEGQGVPDPIQTLVNAGRAVKPMSFPLDAATNVTFMGERYVHGWINQQFSGASGLTLNLV